MLKILHLNPKMKEMKLALVLGWDLLSVLEGDRMNKYKAFQVRAHEVIGQAEQRYDWLGLSLVTAWAQ